MILFKFLAVLFYRVCVAIPKTEIFGLQSIYFSTNGEKWSWKDSAKPKWNFSEAFISTNNVCTWQGIVCNTDNSHVTGFDLSSYNLVGEIPTQIHLLQYITSIQLSSNKISRINESALGNLTLLNSIVLSSNRIATDVSILIQKTSASLKNLKTLRINGNSFYGTIPSSLGLLSSLTQLDISSNRIGGSIPLNIQQLQYLQVLNIGTNRISGSIPTALGKLYSIVNLTMNTNNLIGPIPSTFEFMTNLQYLRIYQNSLIGTIPAALGTVTSLVYLSLYQNCLTGAIPSSLGQATNLYYLGLYTNSLSGTIPAELGSLHKMQFLRFYNNSLTGSIPSSLCKMSAMLIMRLNDNSLWGRSPACSNMPHNLYLDLSGNQLTGTLPETYSNLTSLQYFYLNDNRITGSIPLAYGLLSSLIYLRLDSNMLTGTIPSTFIYLKSMEILLLNHNRLGGYPGTAFEPLRQTRLLNVDISHNNFEGSLPANIFLLPALQNLVTIENCFHGSLPDTICHASQLQLLSLNGLRGGSKCLKGLDLGIIASTYSSSMTGDIPDCVYKLPNIQTLQISGNGFGGRLRAPPEKSRLKILDLSNNKISGRAEEAFQSWNFSRLDVSVNKISGTWSKISSYFQPKFSVIKLAVNRLSGKLPIEFKYAEKVDVLSGNVFGCSSDLPQYDRSYSSYVCGSTGLDTSLIFFAVCLFLNILIILAILAYVALFGCKDAHSPDDPDTASTSCLSPVLWVRNLHVFYVKLHRWYFIIGTNVMRKVGDSGRGLKAKPQMPSPNANAKTYRRGSLETVETKNIRGYLDAFRLQRFCALVLISLILIVCLPLYPSLKKYIRNGASSTQSYQYTWEMSAAFLSGFAPALLLLMLWNALTLVFAMILAYRSSSYHTYLSPHHMDNHVKPNYWVEFRNHLSIYSKATLVLLLDMVVVLLINGVFLYIQLSSYPTSYKMASQFLKAVVGVIIGFIFPEILNFVIKDKSLYIWWLACLMVFNEVAAPIFVTLTISESCFKDFFEPPPPIETVYYFTACLFFSYNTNTNILSCTNRGPLGPLKSSYTPAFIYNNRCSASLFTSYIPALIYSYVLTGYVLPWLTVLLPMTVEHTIVSKYKLQLFFPDILWPLEATRVGTRLFPAPYIMTDYIKDFTMLLTYGIASPPLGICVVGSMIWQTVIWQIAIGRYIDQRKHLNDSSKYQSLENICGDSWRAPLLCAFLVMISSALLQAVVVLDMMADTYDIGQGFWPCLVIVGFALFLRIILLRPFLKCFHDQHRKIACVDEKYKPMPKEVAVSESAKRDINPQEDILIDNPNRVGESDLGVNPTPEHKVEHTLSGIKLVHSNHIP